MYVKEERFCCLFRTCSIYNQTIKRERRTLHAYNIYIYIQKTPKEKQQRKQYIYLLQFIIFKLTQVDEANEQQILQKTRQRKGKK